MNHAMKRMCTGTGLALAIGLLSFSLFAASPTTARPDVPLLGSQGKVDGVSLKQKVIVVQDIARHLAPNYEVVDHKGRRVSAFNVRRGTPVRLELDRQGRVARIIIQR